MPALEGKNLRITQVSNKGIGTAESFDLCMKVFSVNARQEEGLASPDLLSSCCVVVFFWCLAIASIFAYNEYMNKHTSTQYTIRNVPSNVDKALRLKAKESGQSLNEVAMRALTAGSGEQFKPKRNLSFIIGSLSTAEAEEMDAEISAQRKIDPELWK